MHTAFTVAKIEVGHTARAVVRSPALYTFSTYTYQLFSDFVNLPLLDRHVTVMHNTTTAFF
jgi:hypothetical protein